VFVFIENPPQTHTTIFCPIIGNDVIKFVITVDPRKLICPHGNVYPRNAIPAININNITPEHQTHCFGFLYELK